MHFDRRKIKYFPNLMLDHKTSTLLELAKLAPKSRATVGKIINGRYVTEYDKWCTAEFVDYKTFEGLVNLIKEDAKILIKKEYNVNCLDSEIHFLHYKNEGSYKSHIDGQYIEGDIAKRGTDRDITCVLYLNDDFSGGEINFDFFDYQLKPNKGDVLIYPTSWQYVHGVNKVIGNRYAIVIWFKTDPQLNVDMQIKDENILTFLGRL